MGKARCARRMAPALAPEEGFEPPTSRLTAGCSTAELLRKSAVRAGIPPASRREDALDEAAMYKRRLGGGQGSFFWMRWGHRFKGRFRLSVARGGII